LGSADLAGSSGSAETGLTVARDSATVTAFAVTGSATYGAETGLVFTASVSGTNAAIPNESTVAVTSGPTTLCTITLSSGTGSCSPTSGTVLPLGVNSVMATFNAGEPNFTTATGTTTVTVTASPFAGIEWVSVTTTGTFSCNTTAPRAVTCTAAGVGNRGTFQAGVQLVDATRSPFLNATGAPITVAQITTGGGGTTTTSGLVTIAPSTSATPGTFLLTLNPGQPPATTITASVTINQITYTVNCVVTR
jgi:hypothetical protein